MSKNFLFLFFLLPLLAISLTLSAKTPKNQNTNLHGGSIRGLISDQETNAELQGAYIRLLELKLSTASNELGIFSFDDLPSGTYNVAVSFIGYKADTLKVRVSDHVTSNLKFLLKDAPLNLTNIEINAQKSRPLASFSQLDINMRPVNSAQDILRIVPGIFIAQHAGGGKAEQIFLRGFDIDHGTDIALFADGQPVNMVSHAHGQGYADLHFLIPELVEKVDFQKGTYNASVGNFATAGFVKFQTPDRLSENLLKVEAGQFNSYRTVGLIDLLGKNAANKGISAYLGTELLFSNGYFDAPQNFKRSNFFIKYRQVMDDKQTLSISASTFNSNWLASGQIPVRAVKSGQLSHFGGIDNTEGGNTGRQNLNVQHLLALNDRTILKNQVFINQYDFELYSNFTFFAKDSLNGDAIRQKEKRQIIGYNTSLQYDFLSFGKKTKVEIGTNLRYDATKDSELSHVKARILTLNRLKLGDIQEINFAPYADASIEITQKLTLNAGLRYEQFHFSYQDKLDTTAQAFRMTAKSQINPKLNLHYQIRPNLQIFALSGVGLHSNDTRVAVAASEENVLPLAFGHEIGFLYKPTPKILLSFTAFQLNLQQEFVYVGDEAVVEPSGKTRRQGIDVSLRWQMLPFLYLDMDYNLTKPRSIEAAEGTQYIPLAPTKTSIGGLTFAKNGLQTSLRYRYIGDRAANEDYSLTAKGYFLMDAVISYAPKNKNGIRPLEFSLSAQNLANVTWKEAQFETETRLRGEVSPVSEIHYTAGTPFFVKGSVAFRF
jgi:outer membrane receptor protein involved in Fe transport